MVLGLLPFEEARKFTRSLGLKGWEEWWKWCKSGKRPDYIPTNPHVTYKKEWKGVYDWLGTEKNRKYWLYPKAKEYVHSLGLKSQHKWEKYCKSGKKPDYIPSYPRTVYKKEWRDMGDWLGTGTKATQNRIYRPFEEARKFVHRLNLKNQHEWRQYLKSGRKPSDIPNYPEGVYKKYWKGMGDWLGTHAVATINRKFLPFEEARKYVRSLGLKSREEWEKYCISGKKPKDIPSSPRLTYRKLWKGWPDFIGTDSIASQNRAYKSFEEARKYVRSLGLKNQEGWFNYRKSGKRPKDIPSHPDDVYRNEWISWGDFIGYEEDYWSIRKVKELLRDWIESGYIYQEDEIVLYHILTTRGLLNLQQGNRHQQLFKNLINGIRTAEGRKALEKYANSDSELPPGFEEEGEEIGTASSEEIAELVEKENETDPLDYGKIKTVEQILANSETLESYTEDIESMQFYVNKYVKDLWASAFRNEENTVSKVRNEGKNGNKFHDTFIEKFLSEYDGAMSIESPEGYSFPKGKPKLMQKYAAYKVKTNRRFGNFSGTGAGKTLSAILASRIVDSKMTVIICPNAIVDQWEKDIKNTFPDSVIITRKDAFNEEYNENKHKYLVINYDLFSQEYSPNLVLDLVKQKIDFVVLDEIHLTKKRDKSEESQRRTNIEGLMSDIAKKNSGVYVLGMTATPVINELEEGKSLLELITGKIYDDISTRQIQQNAVTLYGKLSLNSIREMPKYPEPQIEDVNVDVDVRKSNISVKRLMRNPLLIEQLTLDAKIPVIIKHIQGPTIIYTEYVEGIVPEISKAVKEAGYTYAEYTGDVHSGLDLFRQKQVQVLVASNPISTGVDGLQEICNNLIISTLPWTNARYQQLIGRLVRLNQKSDVNVYIIKANISGFEYDENKWKRILWKRTLADCAVDGVPPEKNMVTPEQATMELVRWLERLERGEISSIERRDLDVKLTPVEIEQQQQQHRHWVNLSELSKLNSMINNSKSEKIHEKIEKDPQFLVQYHEKLDETRKTWNVEPVDVIANKIKELGLNMPARVFMKMVIGDFGCGRARLVESLKENRVYSFDHHDILNEKIIACDMKRTSLKNEKLDIAVFCLSLMGENWPDYITEAKRCLCERGMLMIAETTKSLSGRLSNLRDEIKKQGFNIYKDEQRGDFTFIEARKI